MMKFTLKHVIENTFSVSNLAPNTVLLLHSLLVNDVIKIESPITIAMNYMELGIHPEMFTVKPGLA